MLTRRALLAGSASSLGLLASGCHKASPLSPERQLWAYNPQDKEELMRSYVKLAGTLDERQVYLQYYGTIMAALPGQMHHKLFRLKGLVRMRWTPGENNTFKHSNYDHGLFCDWETGKALESYENPITGETNTPLHYRSGEIASTIGLGGGYNDPTGLDWLVVGNQVSATRSHVSKFENPVSPEKFPKASTGKYLLSSWSSTYFGDARDLANPKLNGIDADHVWAYVTGLPAWMKMGQQSGFAFWKWTGKKFLDESEIDPYILSEIESRVPGFLTVDKPWAEPSNGWTQYSFERQPDLRNL